MFSDILAWAIVAHYFYNRIFITISIAFGVRAEQYAAGGHGTAFLKTWGPPPP